MFSFPQHQRACFHSMDFLGSLGEILHAFLARWYILFTLQSVSNFQWNKNLPENIIFLIQNINTFLFLGHWKSWESNLPLHIRDPEALWICGFWAACRRGLPQGQVLIATQVAAVVQRNCHYCQFWLIIC